MKRLFVLCEILKVFCFILKHCGLFPLRYCRAKQQWLYQRSSWLKYVPTIVIIFLFGYTQWLFVQNVIEIAALESVGAQPEREYKEFDKARVGLDTFIYGLVPLWSLWKSCELWHLINQSQKAYKHLKNLLGRDFRLDCSWPLFANGLLFLILIVLFGLKTILLDFPATKSDLANYRTYKLCNYFYEISRLIFPVILALRLYYHLLHAGLYESLSRLKLKDNPHYIQGLLQALPYLRRMNYLAGYYFKVSYVYLLILVWNKAIDFIGLLKIDDTELLLGHRKSFEDLEQEAEWAGQDWRSVKSDQPLKEAAIILAWHLGIWILLLSAAGLQQIAHQNFMEKLWDLELLHGAEEMTVGTTSETNIEIWRTKKDIINLMINSGIHLDDFNPTGICFYLWKSKVKVSFINLDHIIGNCKMNLNVLIFFILAYIGTQMELSSLQAYYKQ